MSSGYERVDPRLFDRLSEAPKFQPGLMPAPRRDAQRVIERELQNINTPLPGGVESRIRQLQKMRGPHQVIPEPQPEPQMPLRSVLRRDNMG